MKAQEKDKRSVRLLFVNKISKETLLIWAALFSAPTAQSNKIFAALFSKSGHLR
jgi:hypothetical protein